MLEITNHGRIREIRLARPPVNALNAELVAQLSRSFREAEADCEAVVLSGLKGIFSAGLDVIELLQLDREDMTSFWNAFMELLETIACSSVPVAVAITGHSPAGGAVICLMADYRVMSHGKYKIGLNEARVGLVLPLLLQDALSRLVGPRVAEGMLVGGTLVDSVEASRIGLVDALENGYEATIENAISWCEELLALPRHSMLGNRAIARAHFNQAFGRHTDKHVTAFIDTWFSDEAQSIMNALVAKLKDKG